MGLAVRGEWRPHQGWWAACRLTWWRDVSCAGKKKEDVCIERDNNVRHGEISASLAAWRCGVCIDCPLRPSPRRCRSRPARRRVFPQRCSIKANHRRGRGCVWRQQARTPGGGRRRRRATRLRHHAPEGKAAPWVTRDCCPNPAKPPHHPDRVQATVVGTAAGAGAGRRPLVDARPESRNPSVLWSLGSASSSSSCR